MSGEEAKKTLEAVGGFLFLIRATCLPKDGSRQFEELFDRYDEAVRIAKDAIDIMDDRINIENKGE